MVSLLTHTCATLPHWVKSFGVPHEKSIMPTHRICLRLDPIIKTRTIMRMLLFQIIYLQHTKRQMFLNILKKERNGHFVSALNIGFFTRVLNRIHVRSLHLNFLSNLIYCFQQGHLETTMNGTDIWYWVKIWCSVSYLCYVSCLCAKLCSSDLL